MQSNSNFVSYQSVLENTLKTRFDKIEQVREGRNSLVFNLINCESPECIAKFYYQHPLDKRNRLETEYRTLQFLWKQGICCVPKPIIKDDYHSCAVYQYISGIKKTNHIEKSDMIQAIHFLIQLHRLKKTNGCDQFNPASEAGLSIEDLIKNIEFRLSRLLSVTNDHEKLRNYLINKFQPCLKEIRNSIQKQNLVLDQQIPKEMLTLSPSDFGFHNAILKPDGQWIFLDFEYFGWDDPVKMISDFLLHPAMNLTEDNKYFFWDHMKKYFKDNRFIERFHAVYPLCGLKWCMIFLNEFVPEHYQRRTYAALQSQIDRKQLQEKQLDKASIMLLKVMNEYEKVPYH